MASDKKETDEPKVADSLESEGSVAADEGLVRAPESEGAEAEEGDDQAATSLGSVRYVHAAFFAGAIIAAYVTHKVFGLAWGFLADWQTAANAVPQLLSFSEDERDGATLVAGALVGALIVIQVYRKEGIRRWADEVAMELSKVTWPSREVVLNGTLVVVIASAVATFYVAVLDRFWGFLTNLVYGA